VPGVAGSVLNHAIAGEIAEGPLASSIENLAGRQQFYTSISLRGSAGLGGGRQGDVARFRFQRRSAIGATV